MQVIRTISCKLEYSPLQAQHFEETLKAFADACNFVADYSRANKEMKQFSLHKACYADVRARFSLPANLAVRAIARVAVAFKDKKKRGSTFDPTSADFDSKIFTLNTDLMVASLTLLNKREKFRLKIGHYQRKALAEQKPSSVQLVKKPSGYYLHIHIKEECEPTSDPSGILGVDLGIKSIASLSDGTQFNGRSLNTYRLLRHKVRKSLQSKAHKGKPTTRKNARKVLKQLSGKEQRIVKNVNPGGEPHTISYHIVAKPKANNQVIALEDLSGIRQSASQRLRKSQKGLHNTWSFYQLREFVAYKARAKGVQVVFVRPAYTSKTCSPCFHIGNRSGEKFSCRNCNSVMNADYNGAQNIAAVGGAIVGRPEESKLFCNLKHKHL